jgi:ferredoxin-type protein NapF
MNIHQSRRNFLRGRGSDNLVIRPPWAVDEARFVQGCSRCDKCIEVCPETIIVRGDGGFPVVQFGRGECTYCEKCLHSCPDGVLVRKAEVPPWRHKVVIQESCIVYKGVVCMTCRDQCEPRAIGFTIVPGGLCPPVLDVDLCSGCGACIAPCPSGAIQVVVG